LTASRPKRKTGLVKTAHSVTTAASAALALAVIAGCDSSAPEPTKATADLPATTATATSRPDLRPTSRPMPPRPKPGKQKVSAKPVAEIKVSADDPIKGKWSLEDATKGLPAGAVLAAAIETSMGTIECKLLDKKAPITVANFIGLARGTRPWKTPEGAWEKKPAYDGTIFHRIIKGFMIQGGDAKKNGSGEAGYVIPDEVWEDANHDRPGLLCMANRGPNTNSAQFFITDDAAFHLDNGYTIFGECGPEELIHKIAGVELARGDKPKEPPSINKVTITRKPEGWNPPGLAKAPDAPAPAGSSSAGPASPSSAGPASSSAPAAGSAAPKSAPPPAASK
jgi:peptidyl-prolyl cis-trans isomerase A (cyclophilin A)